MLHSGTQTETLHVTGQLCDTQHWLVVSALFCAVIFIVQIGDYALHDMKVMFFRDELFKFCKCIRTAAHYSCVKLWKISCSILFSPSFINITF
jgi:hypothetical protein